MGWQESTSLGKHWASIESLVPGRLMVVRSALMICGSFQRGRSVKSVSLFARESIGKRGGDRMRFVHVVLFLVLCSCAIEKATAADRFNMHELLPCLSELEGWWQIPEECGSIVDGIVDVNDSKQVIGGRLGIAVSCLEGKVTELGSLEGGYTQGWAINGSGYVVGYSVIPSPGCPEQMVSTDSDFEIYHWECFDHRAFLWSEDLGMLSLGGDHSKAYDINEDGVVVGSSSYTERRLHAVLWIDLAMVDLGTLGGEESQAFSINDVGEVVGWAEDTDGNSRAFMWDSLNGMQDLNDLLVENSEWRLAKAFDIDDAGNIIAEALIDGRQRDVLLTPLSETPAPACGELQSGQACGVWSMGTLFGSLLGLLSVRSRRFPL